MMLQRSTRDSYERTEEWRTTCHKAKYLGGNINNDNNNKSSSLFTYNNMHKIAKLELIQTLEENITQPKTELLITLTENVC